MTSLASPTPTTSTTCRLSRRALRTHNQPISYLMLQAVANPRAISLAAGLVDQESLPAEEVRETLDALFADIDVARAALQYGSTPGSLRLRELLVAHLEQLEGLPAAGMSIEPAHVVVTTGSQQLLQLVADALVDPGDIVLVGAPDYFVFLGVLAGVGAQVVAVPMDEDGLIPEALDETLATLAQSGELPRVKLVYCDSYHQNPSGVTLSAQRRPAVLEIVRRWSTAGKIYLLEDAAYRELGETSETPRSIRSYDTTGETVILAQTFSKSFSPGLKTGYGFLPPELIEPVEHLKGNHDFGSPNFNQQLLAAVLASGRYVEHVARLRAVYHAKRQAMLAAVEQAFAHEGIAARWIVPRGGLYVWVVLPEEFDTTRNGLLFAECLRRGVLYVAGEYCFLPDYRPPHTSPLGGPRNTLRLTFGCLGVERMREGVSRLAAAVAHCGQRR